ncbi:MAG TPA: VanZ family protein [Gallionella sp.]|nr:VanZ family protein [Gallionella sp.]
MHKLRRAWLILGWFWIAAVFYISLMPNPPEPVRFPNIDKLEHAFTYCLLMLWFSQVYVRRLRRLFAAAWLVAMGVAIEILQDMTGYRLFEYGDMLANATGVVLGWVWARTALGQVGRTLETKFLK